MRGDGNPAGKGFENDKPEGLRTRGKHEYVRERKPLRKLDAGPIAGKIGPGRIFLFQMIPIGPIADEELRPREISFQKFLDAFLFCDASEVREYGLFERRQLRPLARPEELRIYPERRQDEIAEAMPFEIGLQRCGMDQRATASVMEPAQIAVRERREAEIGLEVKIYIERKMRMVFGREREACPLAEVPRGDA